MRSDSDAGTGRNFFTPMTSSASATPARGGSWARRVLGTVLGVVGSAVPSYRCARVGDCVPEISFVDDHDAMTLLSQLVRLLDLSPIAGECP